MLLGITQNEIVVFLMILLRISSAMIVFPVFNSLYIPTPAKIGISLVLSLIISPLVISSQMVVPEIVAQIIFVLVKEVLVGLVLGFLASMIFACVELAGQLVSMQMGFGIVNVYDPQTSRQIPIVGQFYLYLAMMVFLAIDGHHFLIEGLYKSFQVIPPSTATFRVGIVDLHMSVAADIFVAAIKIGAPIIVSLLLTSVALGLVARAVPQMNVFFVGMPLKIAMGLAAMAISLPLFAYFFTSVYHKFQTDFLQLMRLMQN